MGCDGSFFRSTCWQMLTIWHINWFLSPKHRQNFSQKETTPPPTTTPAQLSISTTLHQKKQQQHSLSTKPTKKNKKNTTFLGGVISIRSIREVCAQLADAWVGRMPSSTWRGAVTRLRVPRWATHSFGVEVFLRRYTMELKACRKQSCKTCRCLFCREKTWTNMGMFHVQFFGCKWKCLGFWKEETKLMTQVTWASIAVYVFTCMRVVVESASCSWNISISFHAIQQSSGDHICNLGNVPKTHPTYKRNILNLGVKLKWKNL